MENEIKQFINSENKELKLLFLPINDYMDLLKSLNYEREELEDNINGWSIDFCYYFNFENKRLCLEGSLWYGNFKLSKIE